MKLCLVLLCEMCSVVYASAPNCPTGTIERIRFNADPMIVRDEEAKGNDNDNDKDNEQIYMETYIKVDTIEGECYTKIIHFQPVLLGAFSAYPFGIQIQPHSEDCLSGYSNFFRNFTLTTFADDPELVFCSPGCIEHIRFETVYDENEELGAQQYTYIQLDIKLVINSIFGNRYSRRSP
ncbi:uncharacterized protein LOC129568152 [Sitodiplosis mosellana]|uniref:uncharacterized protein LOC129568152 n=1 Tax=Sitodiplosis mosellana TaxID=263140 RepID=UPI002443A157|nr:uncharacterized protein LOC129568152 [Sitodiplosis mosellana]